MEAAGPPVDRGIVNEWGQDGVFVCEGGGEGPWFVSMGDLEDQTLMDAVVVVVDLVLVVLHRMNHLNLSEQLLKGLVRTFIFPAG